MKNRRIRLNKLLDSNLFSQEFVPKRYKFRDGRAKSDISLASLSTKRFGMEVRMTFGEKLKEVRRQAGMSQEKLAEKLGVSRHEPAIIRLNQEKPIKQGFALI